MKISRRSISIVYLVLLVICLMILVIGYPIAIEQSLKNYDIRFSLFLSWMIIPCILVLVASLITVITGLKFTLLSKKLMIGIRFVSLFILVIYITMVVSALFFKAGSLVGNFILIIIYFKSLFVLIGIAFNATFSFGDKKNSSETVVINEDVPVMDAMIEEVQSDNEKEPSTDDSLVQ